MTDGQSPAGERTLCALEGRPAHESMKVSDIGDFHGYIH